MGEIKAGSGQVTHICGLEGYGAIGDSCLACDLIRQRAAGSGDKPAEPPPEIEPASSPARYAACIRGCGGVDTFHECPLAPSVKIGECGESAGSEQKKAGTVSEKGQDPKLLRSEPGLTSPPLINEHSPMKSEVKEVPASGNENKCCDNGNFGEPHECRKSNPAEAVEGAGLAHSESAEIRAKLGLIPEAPFKLVLIKLDNLLNPPAPGHPSCPKCGSPGPYIEHVEEIGGYVYVECRNGHKTQCIGVADFAQFFTPRTPEAAEATSPKGRCCNHGREEPCPICAKAANFVQVMDESTERKPSCQVCGAIMSRYSEFIGEVQQFYWWCGSCGATTQPADPE